MVVVDARLKRAGPQPMVIEFEALPAPMTVVELCTMACPLLLTPGSVALELLTPTPHIEVVVFVLGT